MTIDEKKQKAEADFEVAKTKYRVVRKLGELERLRENGTIGLETPASVLKVDLNTEETKLVLDTLQAHWEASL